MRRFRREILGWLGLVGLLGALIGPTVAAADPTTTWRPGPDAVLDDTYDGFIDTRP